MGAQRTVHQASGGVLARALIGALGVLGCISSTPHDSIAKLTAQARANELKAVADHQGEQLRVAAVVTGSGIKKVQRVVGTPVGWGYTGGWSAGKKTTSYPYITARDPSRPQAGGELLCFFDPSYMSDIAELDHGAEVILTGEFQEFTEGGSKLVLHSCELE